MKVHDKTIEKLEYRTKNPEKTWKRVSGKCGNPDITIEGKYSIYSKSWTLWGG